MKRLKQGWIDDLPNDEYHWGEPYAKCLNKSKLEKLVVSPAHCAAVEKSDPTKPLRIGDLFHQITLLGTDPTQLRFAFKADEVETACHMTEAVLSHKKAAGIIKSSIKERSGIYKDPDYAFWCKIRTDIQLPGLGILGDLKSTRNAHPPSFKKDALWLRYHWQGWKYLRGANAIESFKAKKIIKPYHTFLIIACEKKPPYGVMIYKIGQYLLDQAEQEVMPLLELYKRCLDKNEWPSYPEEIMEI